LGARAVEPPVNPEPTIPAKLTGRRALNQLSFRAQESVAAYSHYIHTSLVCVTPELSCERIE